MKKKSRKVNNYGYDNSDDSDGKSKLGSPKFISFSFPIDQDVVSHYNYDFDNKECRCVAVVNQKTYNTNQGGGVEVCMEDICNAVVTTPIIIWSNTWSKKWSNMWPTDIIFLEANRPYPHYYLTCHRYPSSKTSIKPTILEARRGHQLVDQCSKTFTNIVIIFIDAIYKKFYECWSSCISS